MTSNFFYINYHRPERSEARPGATNVVEARAPWQHTPGQVSTEPIPGFAQREAILCTAGDDVLPGITRQTVLEVAEQMRLEVKYQALNRDQLAEADEAFITSSSRGIVPVIQIDKVIIGHGAPGPVTKQLSAAYESYVTENAEKIL